MVNYAIIHADVYLIPPSRLARTNGLALKAVAWRGTILAAIPGQPML